MPKKLSPAEEIYAAIATQKHKYRRCGLQPGDQERITEIFDQALEDGSPVELLMFWGQGQRDYVAAPEEMAAEFLAIALGNISSRISNDVVLNLVFCDSHIKFNGYEYSEEYQKQVTQLIRDKFAEQSGNLVVKPHLMSEVAGYTPTKDGKSFKQYQEFEGMAASVELDPELQRSLTFAAMKNYKGQIEDPELAAKNYYLLNLFENGPLAEKFEGSIFLTYNNRLHKYITPEGMPTFYMNSLNKNTSMKPWFTDERIVEPATLSQSPDIVGPANDKGGRER